MTLPEDCFHKTLYFGSGGFYVICQDCQNFWSCTDPWSNKAYINNRVGTSDLRCATNGADKNEETPSFTSPSIC